MLGNHWLVFKPCCREATQHRRNPSHTNLTTTTYQPRSYPRKGKADSASSNHRIEVLDGLTVGVFLAKKKTKKKNGKIGVVRRVIKEHRVVIIRISNDIIRLER